MLLIRRNKIVLLLSFLILSAGVFAQVPSKVEKLVGKWNFNGGSGYETFEVKNGKLVGQAFLSTKNGISYHVETIRIALVNKNLVYTSIPVENDSLIESRKDQFISDGRSLKFYNVENGYPSAIKYKIGCFNKNKLKIFIYPIVGDQKKKVLKLTKDESGTI